MVVRRHLGDPQALLPSFGIWQGKREGFDLCTLVIAVDNPT